MARRHKWSSKAGDAKCTRIDCGRLRLLVGGQYEYGYKIGMFASDVAGECEGSDKPKPKAEEKTGKHDFKSSGDVDAVGNDIEECVMKGCRVRRVSGCAVFYQRAKGCHWRDEEEHDAPSCRGTS